MPPLTRWFVKSSLLYLVAALVIGVALTIQGPTLPPFLQALTPVYFHLFMVGWVTQLIFGVSLWMFPRYSKERPRGREGLALATYLALNLGLIARAVAEPLHALRPAPASTSLLLLSAALQWFAGLAYVVTIWGRVKER
jgi:hypothetical protein